MSGLDRLLSREELPFPQARIGFLGHHASVTHSGRHAVEALIDRSEWEIVKLFSPEHGFFGKAGPGERVESSLHPRWGIPVYSLYGEHRSPQPEWLNDLDLMVIDLQDLGVRCYTYASTLSLMLKACAEAKLAVLVLDRPSPLEGCMDGPGLSPDHISFVGMIDLPLVFGFGQGKLATFLQSHDQNLKNLKLQVIVDPDPPQPSDEWIPPSPAIVSRASAQLYPLTVWCEAIPDIWVDRGGKTSFQVWLMRDFPQSLLDTPLVMKGLRVLPYTAPTPDGIWKGFRFEISDLYLYRPIQSAVELLCALRDHLGADRLFTFPGARPEFFDQLMGTHSVREQILNGWDAKQIIADW